MKSSLLITALIAAVVIPVVATLVSDFNQSANAASTSVSSRDSLTWSNGLSSDPNYFPIAVWLQSPHNATAYKAAGINLYVGLWQGPTEAQLAALKAAEMPVICEQNEVGLAHKSDKIIV